MSTHVVNPRFAAAFEQYRYKKKNHAESIENAIGNATPLSERSCRAQDMSARGAGYITRRRLRQERPAAALSAMRRSRVDGPGLRRQRERLFTRKTENRRVSYDI